MANPAPAYSILGVTYTALPGAYRYGGRPRSQREENINLESDSGVEFIYRLSKKKEFELIFTLTDAQLTTHEAMDTATDGEITPFYFSMLGDGSDAVLVRKQAGFDPKELEQPKRISASAYTPMYDYILRLREALV